MSAVQNISTPVQDADLLRQMRHGDANAFTALYARLQGPLYRFLLLRCRSAETAADLVQDIFIALMEDKLHYDFSRGPLQNFLFGVARNFALKREELNGRYTTLPEDDDESITLPDHAPQPLERLLGLERADVVRHALLEIAPHYRDVLILYELHELSYVEIAQICNIDLGTVRSRLNRARGKLHDLLSRDERTSPPINSSATRSTSRRAEQEARP